MNSSSFLEFTTFTSFTTFIFEIFIPLGIPLGTISISFESAFFRNVLCFMFEFLMSIFVIFSRIRILLVNLIENILELFFLIPLLILLSILILIHTLIDLTIKLPLTIFSFHLLVVKVFLIL